MMINELWKDVMEANAEASSQYKNEKTDNAILLLRLSIRRTETLIAALEREVRLSER